MTLTRLRTASQQQLLKLLRWRVWVQEKLQPTDWQVTLLWAAAAGVLGALAALLFTSLTEGTHRLLTGSRAGIVESMRLLPWWGALAVPTLGGVLTGLIIRVGQKLLPGQSSTDYMEAIALGSGRLPLRASLTKIAASLFAIGSGASIGREGPLVQLAALVSSLIGRWRGLPPPRARLLIACGGAAGIASAYNAPIGGSFFIAEIVLGTIAMESLGPLAVSAVAAALTLRTLTNAAQLYAVPAFHLGSLWEIGPYVLLGLLMGAFAPLFLRSLRRAETFFVGLHLPLVLRLGLGGLLVGAVATRVPEVCGNGYTVVVDILNGEVGWLLLVLLLACKWFATASSFGSGAPGGVFTPSLFMGASSGFLFGTAVHALWPAAAGDPRAFALVGMGAFLGAVSHAPLMAIIMLFEMTLSYDIVLPLMLCTVIAFYTAKSFWNRSLYSESLQRKAAEAPAADPLDGHAVEAFMKADPPRVAFDARFAEIARLFLSERVNYVYVTTPERKFLGVVALHDIKPFLSEPALADVVIAGDILHDDFPFVRVDESLGQALNRFLGVRAERLPVLSSDGRLLGSLAKSDLLLALVELQKRPTPKAQPAGAEPVAAPKLAAETPAANVVCT
ncbi:MAG: ClcB-like voltage-gated chloride channel protein [Opitutae bacterium]|nr:ClcB-like voltage-gated chloride channel protein [Opitutae bacterium]